MVSALQLRAQWSQSFAPADRTLPAMLTRQAERFAQKPLVAAGGTTWTYADTYEAAARCAGTLRSAGIEPGDRVAVICSNRIEFLEIVLGCAWLGAIAVPINVASRGPQLQHILSNCAARLLVMEAAYAENLALLDQVRLIEYLVPRLAQAVAAAQIVILAGVLFSSCVGGVAGKGRENRTPGGQAAL